MATKFADAQKHLLWKAFLDHVREADLPVWEGKDTTEIYMVWQDARIWWETFIAGAKAQEDSDD